MSTITNNTRPNQTVASQNVQQTSNNPTWSDGDLIQQGTEQGIRVAGVEQSNPDFDVAAYAQSIVPYLSGLGLSADQQATYLKAMVSEFQYLTPTAKLDPSHSGVGSDILNEVLPCSDAPGQAEDPHTTTPQTLNNQGTILGQQLAAVQNENSSNFDIAAYTENVVKQMTAAGYNGTQTKAFRSGVLAGYISALGGYLSQ